MFGTRHPRRPTAETGSDALRSPMCVITPNSQERKGACCIFFIEKYYDFYFYFLPKTNQLKNRDGNNDSYFNKFAVS